MSKFHQNKFAFKIVWDKETNRKKLQLLSEAYFRHFLHNKAEIGNTGTLTVSFKKPTRSESQLRYYAVIVGLLAEHCGTTWEEMHDAMMKLKWGTKKIMIGDKAVEVRRSVSDNASFPKSDMVEQIMFVLEECQELGIRVPTAEELGYMPTTSFMQPHTPVLKEKTIE